MSIPSEKRDLTDSKAIELLISRFYGRIKQDSRLSSVFFELAQIKIEKHLPIINSYWRKLLLGDNSYNRHTINIHRELHKKADLSPSDFDRWLALFSETVDDEFSGPIATRAKKIASNIANNMRASITGID